jgi:hypothetical protein
MTGSDAAGALVALTARLSFPRRTGTGGNDRAREIIANELKARDYDVTEEGFWYVPRRMHATNLALVISLIFADYGIFAILWFSLDSLGWLVVVMAVGLLSLLFLQHSIPLRWRMRDTLEGKAEAPRNAKRGTNIVAGLHNLATTDPDPSLLVVGAHHDSISLLFPPAINLFVYLGNTVGVLLVAILAVIEGLVAAIAGPTSPWFRVAVALLCLLTCCTLVAKLANKRSNRSDGAVDNATGCAVLLELARACKEAGGESRFSEIRFVFFDAEEEGLWGSAFHASMHEEEFRTTFKGRACFISLDESGGSGTFVASGSFGFPKVTRHRPDPGLKGLIDELIRRNKKGLKTWMPYPASDHAPFVEIGIPSVWLSHACTNANTSRDKIDGVSGEHMGTVLQALLGFVKAPKKEETGNHADT